MLLDAVSLPITDSFGDKVTSLVVAALPLIFKVDSGDIWDRLIIAGCGALGSIIAIVADKPTNWQETAGRIASGFISCALFIPWVARRYGFFDQSDSLIAAAALCGILAWYVAGSSVRFLTWVRTSGIVSDILRRQISPNSLSVRPENFPSNMAQALAPTSAPPPVPNPSPTDPR